MNTEPKLEFPKNIPPHLSSYVKARVMHSLREGDEDVDRAVKTALRSAITVGISSIRDEAIALLDTRDRVGPNTNNKKHMSASIDWRPAPIFWRASRPYVDR